MLIYTLFASSGRMHDCRPAQSRRWPGTLDCRSYYSGSHGACRRPGPEQEVIVCGSMRFVSDWVVPADKSFSHKRVSEGRTD